VLLWQFIVLTVLIGGLLVCGSILTRRLGCMNARLKRIEEALLVKDRPIEHADARAAQAEGEVPGKEGRVDYLTIRDLKVSSERLSARATRSSSRSSVVVPESRDALSTTRVPMSSPGATSERGDSVATSTEGPEALRTCSEQVSSVDTRPLNEDSVSTSLENRDVLEAISEPPSSPTMRPESGDSVATSSESRDALETTGGPQSPPGSHTPSEDSVAKKNRETLLMLNSQRRRRRARLGY
jgi:hypothetical protein